MTDITTLEAYSDDRGNEIVFDGKVTTGISVRFAGRNNKLIVRSGSKIANTTFLFDCDDGVCEVGNNSFRGSIRIGERSRVVLGDGLTVIDRCYISAVEHASVVIGHDCMFGARNEIRADDAHPIFDVVSGERVNLPRSIRIGDHVWISTGAIVLGGSEIGDGSIIGHSSVVKGIIPNNCTAAGSPAKVRRENVAWERPHLSMTRPFYKPDAESVKRSQYWAPTRGPSQSQPRPQPQSKALAAPSPSAAPAGPAARESSPSDVVRAKGTSDHPYSSLPDRAFWRKTVGDRNPLALTDLYRRKYVIHPEDRIVTAGSCFAQHIARSLRSSGFRFCDYEPAPPLFPADQLDAYNYGVYSARYCNIYTARQLLQTFERAFGLRRPAESVWESDEGFLDAFRPALEPRPFATLEELRASRESHLASVRDVFTKSDLFIFTMGLTEGWESKLDGSVYPLCPGTSGGRFDSERYAFRNFTFPEIHADMLELLAHLRKANPRLKVLLTVSPVPLVATQSGEHVVSATSYSKSVLRAVAGQLASEHEHVDYFPSYEIIASPPMRAMFYEPNMRGVTPAGVSFVMSHFFAEHRPVERAGRSTSSSDPGLEERDAVCEEMLLDQGL